MVAGSGSWVFVAGVVIALANSVNEDRKFGRRTTFGLVVLRAVYMSTISLSLYVLLPLLSRETLVIFMLIGVCYAAWQELEKL
jgi:threonine/homoserine/homoserine lactone efflux protein